MAGASVFRPGRAKNTVGMALATTAIFAVISSVNGLFIASLIILALQILWVAAYYELSRPKAALTVIAAGVLSYAFAFGFAFVVTLWGAPAALASMLFVCGGTFFLWNWEKQQPQPGPDPFKPSRKRLTLDTLMSMRNPPRNRNRWSPCGKPIPRLHLRFAAEIQRRRQFWLMSSLPAPVRAPFRSYPVPRSLRYSDNRGRKRGTHNLFQGPEIGCVSPFYSTAGLGAAPNDFVMQCTDPAWTMMWSEGTSAT